MRKTVQATLEHYLRALDLSGDVLEVGGYRLEQCAIEVFPEPRFRYVDADISDSDIPNVVAADITDCRAQFADESFDVVLSCDVFEHIDRPWLAAAEISRILRPGGIAFTRTVWSWRNHPCPIDYWRFSPECLDFLFSGLDSLETGYDLSERRWNMPGFWDDGLDSVPVDAYGGFRENWAVYSVHRKGSGPDVPKFKDSGDPLAKHLRRDTQGTVTNPKLLGLPAPPELQDVAGRFAGLERRITDLSGAMSASSAAASAELVSRNETLARQNTELLAELKAARRALDKRIVDMGQPAGVRAFRKLRRRLAARRG